MIFITAVAILNLLLSFLVLASVGRLHIRMNEAERIEVEKHNWMLKALTNLRDSFNWCAGEIQSAWVSIETLLAKEEQQR